MSFSWEPEVRFSLILLLFKLLEESNYLSNLGLAIFTLASMVKVQPLGQVLCLIGSEGRDQGVGRLPTE